MDYKMTWHSKEIIINAESLEEAKNKAASEIYKLEGLKVDYLTICVDKEDNQRFHAIVNLHRGCIS